METNQLRKISKRKSQVRMTETVGILFVFFILLVFGFVFYSKIETNNMGTQLSEAQDMKAVEIAEIITNLPELACTSNNVVRNNCLDTMKLDAMKKINSVSPPKYSTSHYYDLFLKSKITVIEKYPVPTTKQWLIYNMEPVPPNTWKKKTVTYIPVVLYYPTGDPSKSKPEYFTFGVIQVDTYN